MNQTNGDNTRSSRKTLTEGAKDALNDTVENMRDKTDDMAEAASDMVAEGKSRVGKLMEKAGEAKDAVVAGAGTTLAAVRDAAVEKADEARSSLSDAGERIADTLRRASEDGEGQALKSRVLQSVAQGVSSASEALRDRTMADIGADIRAMARRHPVAFMAAAAFAGFAVARLFRSSSHRDSDYGPRS